MSRARPTAPQAHTTVIQSRLPLFLPVLRLAPRARGADIVVENPWGSIKIKKCRLTQVHRDLLDAIFTSTKPPVWLDDGAMVLIFDLRDVQRLLKTSHNHTWIRALLDDMLRTVVEIDDSRHRWIIHQGLLREHRYTREPAPRRRGQKTGALYAVTLSPGFARLWREDLLVHSPRLVPRVLALRHAASRALARMILTHREASLTLDDALRHIGAIQDGLAARVARRTRAKVLSEAAALATFGIQIGADGVIRYRQTSGVWFKLLPAQPAPPSAPASTDRPFEREALDLARRGETPETALTKKLKVMGARRKRGDT